MIVRPFYILKRAHFKTIIQLLEQKDQGLMNGEIAKIQTVKKTFPLICLNFS